MPCGHPYIKIYLSKNYEEVCSCVWGWTVCPLTPTLWSQGVVGCSKLCVEQLFCSLGFEVNGRFTAFSLIQPVSWKENWAVVTGAQFSTEVIWGAFPQIACIFTLEMSCLFAFPSVCHTDNILNELFMVWVHPHVTESAPADFIPRVFYLSLVLMFSFLQTIWFCITLAFSCATSLIWSVYCFSLGVTFTNKRSSSPINTSVSPFHRSRCQHLQKATNLQAAW